ncbi:MAG: hypothetical protein H7Y11_14010 [Armatimonadetes bacterium]|nr:hypothetical protein [Anaerolineae bacterium]
MNQFMETQWSTFSGTHKMRDDLLDSFSDADLAFSPGGSNMTLGELCREMGETEYSYLQSLKTLTQEWSYRATDPSLTTSISALKAWYHTMDTEMEAVVSAMSDDDFKKAVERGFPITVDIQMQIYLQALLIFFGKATIYVKAMNRPLSDIMQSWIG